MAKTAPRSHHRHLKNYLLDKSFQLKYAGFIAIIAAVLSLALGFLLWRTSESLVSQSQESVTQGQQVVELGRKVASESKKVTEVVAMNIVEDPVYKDNPELLEAFKGDSKKKDKVLVDQQAALEKQAASLKQQAASIESKQDTMLLTLFLALFALVVAVGLAGIVITHKVAGPVFKMTRQIQELGEGHWKEPAPLRKGDELRHFFEAWATTVSSLRAMREAEIKKLDQAIAELDDEEVSAELEALRADMQAVLDG